MANLTLSNFSSALKLMILPYIKDNFPKKTIVLDQFKRNANVTVVNDHFVAPIYTTRHGGVANLNVDSDSIINSGGRGLSQGTVFAKIVSGALDISKMAIDASKSNTLAVENALTAQTRTLASDFARQINRQIYGGQEGVVTQARQTGGSVSGTEIAIEAVGNGTGADDGRVLDTYGTINGDIAPNKYLAANAIIGVGTAAAAVGTVAAITGTSIQLTGATASAASDSIYLLDGSGRGAGTAEFLGMRNALNSQTGASTYAGLARNVVGWTPQFGSSSEALTLSRMENTYLSAKEYAELDDPYIILVNKTLYKKYGDLLTSMRREVNETDLLGGWTGLSFAAGAGKVGVFLDYDVPDGEVLTINLNSWTITQISDPDWVEDPAGGGLLRLQNSILYQAVMIWFANIMCLAPAANGKETRKTS